LTSTSSAVAPPIPSSGGIGTSQPGARADFFCNGVNENHVLIATLAGGRTIYTHSTYVRELAADNGNLYFSEASGAGRDGIIYKFRDASYSSVDTFHHVRIREVGGFWAGNFAFGQARTLYLSNGNERPAAIWKLPNIDERPQKIFEHADIISGFCVIDAGRILFTQQTNRIFLLHVQTQTIDVIHESPQAGMQFCDVTWHLPTL
jgi:hypothetical protein